MNEITQFVLQPKYLVESDYTPEDSSLGNTLYGDESYQDGRDEFTRVYWYFLIPLNDIRIFAEANELSVDMVLSSINTILKNPLELIKSKETQAKRIEYGTLEKQYSGCEITDGFLELELNFTIQAEYHGQPA